VAGWVVAAWVFLVVLWAGGAIDSWTFTLFLVVLLGAIAGTGLAAAKVVRGKAGLRGARAAVVMALALAVPVVFDPHTSDVFDLPKYTVVVLGALVLAALFVVQTVRDGRPPMWRNGMHWLVIAFGLWTLVSALSSVNVHLSVLGAHGSYDGLYSALAFVTITFAAAEAFDAVDVPAVLGTLAFGAGSVAAYYGLVQIHDLETKGGHWDFVHWIKGLPFHNVFSTLGNPNHLAGYIAIVLPTCLIVGLRGRSRLVKAAVGLLVAVLIAELLQTAARGAWVATIASALVLVVALWPEIRRRPLVPALGAAVAVLGATAIFILGGAHYIGGKISDLFNSSGRSSVGQRFDMWSASLHIGLNHPITGTGPDSFVYVFPRYENASWVKNLGFTYAADGAHDIFMNTLADKGFVGLAILVALVAYVGLRGVGALRRLRAVERSGGRGAEDATAKRMMLAAVTAGLVAYVVQAVFNVQQIALSFSWWLLLGLFLVVSASAGVPASLSLKKLLVLSKADASTTGVPEGGSGRGRRRAGAPTYAVAATGVACAVVVAVLAYGADGPWRAGHDYWAAALEQRAYVRAEHEGASRSTLNALGAAYFADIRHAMVLNPWAARYPAAAGVDLAVAATKATKASAQRSDLDQARTYLAAAVRAEPEASQYRYELAQVYAGLAHVYPASARAYYASAVSEQEQAVHWEPRDPAFRKYLATLRKDLSSAG